MIHEALSRLGENCTLKDWKLEWLIDPEFVAKYIKTGQFVAVSPSDDGYGVSRYCVCILLDMSPDFNCER